MEITLNLILFLATPACDTGYLRMNTLAQYLQLMLKCLSQHQLVGLYRLQDEYLMWYRVQTLTQLVMKGSAGQQGLHSEFEELPRRSRGFVLRVLSQDLLYHETPVAVSSVVWVNVRRIVMRPHVQMMLHNLAVRSPQRDTERSHRVSLPSVARAGSHIPSVMPPYNPRSMLSIEIIPTSRSE